MSLESLEWWKNTFEISGVILLLLTFIAGSGVLLFSRRVNEAQAERLRQFDKGLTEAKTELGRQQERAAKAEEGVALAEQHVSEADAKAEGFRLDIAKANESAARAQASLALAEQHAAEANTKAEGFRLDIARANESSAKAEAKVASATAEAAKANLELARLKTPRSLKNTAELVNVLKAFSGTEFSFGSVFGDDESMDLLKQIDQVFAEAGWKRVKQSKIRLGITAVTITGKDDLVELGIKTGVRIEAEATDSLEALQAMSPGSLPSHIKVASSLSNALLGYVTPPEVSPDARVNIA